MPESEEVVAFMLQVVLGTCAVQAKVPMVMGGTPAMGGLLEAAGFTKHQSPLYVATPGQPPPKPKKKPTVAKKKKAAKKKASKRKRKPVDLFED